MSELSEEGEVRSPVHVKVIPVITPTRRDQVRGDRRGSGWNQNNFRGRGGGMRYAPAGHRGQGARMSYPNNPRGGPMSGSNGRQWKERGMGRGHPPRHEPRYEPRHHNYNPFFHRNGHRENPGRGRAQAQAPPRTPLVTPLQPQPQQEPSVPAKDLKEDRNKFRLDMATLMTQFEAQVDGVLGVVDEEGRRKFQGLMIRSFFALSIEKQDSSPANRSRLAQCLNEMLGYVKKTLGTTPAGKNLPLLPNDPDALALTPGAPPDARLPFWTIAPPPALLGQIPGLNGNRPCSSAAAAQGESPQDYSLPRFGPFAKQSSPSCPPETGRPVNNKGGFSRSDQDERVWSGQRGQGQGSGMQTRPGSGWGGY